VVVLAGLAIPGPAHAQEAQANVALEAADSVEAPPSTGRPSPGGAFLRSVLVPGWGQAASGSYGRAAFYFLAQAGNVWMAYKTDSLRGLAKIAPELTGDWHTEPLPLDKIAPLAFAGYQDLTSRAGRGRALVEVGVGKDFGA